MKRDKLKEMIRQSILAELEADGQYEAEKEYGFYNEAEIEEDLDELLARLSEEEIEEGEDKVVDPYLAEAEEGEDAEEEIKDELDIDVDTEEEVDGEEKSSNDSIVIDKKIVSLSSLPGETRKILDSLETLRAQAEEFGDQKFITQVGNTITFFTRDFVVAGDQPTMAKVDEAKSKELKVGEKVDVFNKGGKYSKESWWGPDEYLNNAEIVNITGEKVTVKDINDDKYEIDSSDVSKLDESVAFPLWNKIK
jgi:hypothetical protein